MSAATLIDLGSLLMRSADSNLVTVKMNRTKGKWCVMLTFDDGRCWATRDDDLERACNRAAEYIMNRSV